MKRIDFIFKIRKLINAVFGLKDNGVYYINGPETLPAPLSPEKEAELIATIDTDPEARKLLAEHNLRLVVYIARKFENTGVGIEDLISIGTIGLMKAVGTFKPDKQIKLATYASRCIENEILMYARKNASAKSELSIDEPINSDRDGNELLLSDLIGTDDESVYRNIEEEEEKRIIRTALNGLPERDRLIIEMRFGINHPEGKEMTQKDVADMLNISQSYISRLEKRIIARLKDELIKLGLGS